MNGAEMEYPLTRASPHVALPGPVRTRAGWAILALGIAILAALLPFAVGLFGAAVLYVVCSPVHRALTPRLGTRWAAALVLVGTLLLILAPGALLVSAAMGQASGVLRGMPASPAFERLAGLRIAGIDVGAQIMAASGTMLSWVSQQAFVVFGGLARTIINLVIAFFGLYYLLVARPGTWERARGYLPFSAANSDLLRARFHNVTEATLLGIALTALLQGTLIGGTFRLLGLPNALFWGILTGLVSVLPVLGSAIVWLPGALVLAFAGRYGAAIGLALVGGVVASNLDNLVRMVIFKRVSDIHPMVTLVGAFAGVKYMGLIGVLLGPLAITYFFELLRVYQDEHGGVTARQTELEEGR
jgi:predicted PurR-regulated permease PerM